MRNILFRNSVPAEQADLTRPLCVDLDGTLIKSDSLFDAVCQFLRRRSLPTLANWGGGCQRGRARLKAEVASRAPLNSAQLPYNTELLLYLHAERRQGRQIYLTTGADGPLAERVAAHLGIFAGVLASDGVTNLTSALKLECREGAPSANSTTSQLPRRPAFAGQCAPRDGG